MEDLGRLRGHLLLPQVDVQCGPWGQKNPQAPKGPGQHEAPQGHAPTLAPGRLGELRGRPPCAGQALCGLGTPRVARPGAGFELGSLLGLLPGN